MVTPMIFTQRLMLRPLQSSDCETLVCEFTNYNIVRNTARIPFPYHRDDAEDYLRFVGSLNPQSKSLAIAIKSAPQQLIGVVSYLYSEDKKDAELGYWLSENHWGKGLMTEAALAMVDHAFRVSKTEKLVACYHDDNAVSAKILNRLGFSKTGTCTDFSKAQAKEVSVTNMTLTRDVWLSLQKSRGE